MVSGVPQAGGRGVPPGEPEGRFKIFWSALSWLSGCRRPACCATMQPCAGPVRAAPGTGPAGHPPGGPPVTPSTHLQETVMTKTWQTPAATDLRFGFEITMYVAAR